MYRRAEAIRPRTWTQVEDAFIRAMEGFDANVAAGVADIGELQNGKGDFLKTSSLSSWKAAEARSSTRAAASPASYSRTTTST